LLSVDFFACKNKRSATERAKDAWKFILNSFSGGGSLGDGGLTAENWRNRMFYTYILRSISQPEQRYIGSTADLKSRLAKHNKGDVVIGAILHILMIDNLLHINYSPCEFLLDKLDYG